tara:strand:- start:20 stop:262 length:243 start_codon:yes stop_codon:yes gene_type:complete
MSFNCHSWAMPEYDGAGTESEETAASRNIVQVQGSRNSGKGTYCIKSLILIINYNFRTSAARKNIRGAKKYALPYTKSKI